jgi:hypothetical protein
MVTLIRMGYGYVFVKRSGSRIAIPTNSYSDI